MDLEKLVKLDVFGPKWPFLGQNGENDIFSQKSENVTSVCLLGCLLCARNQNKPMNGPTSCPSGGPAPAQCISKKERKSIVEFVRKSMF